MTQQFQPEEDAPPVHVVERLRATGMPDAAVERRLIAELERRGVLETRRRRSRTPWLIAATAAASFLVGLHLGERRASSATPAVPPIQARETAADNAENSAVAVSSTVLWF